MALVYNYITMLKYLINIIFEQTKTLKYLYN